MIDVGPETYDKAVLDTTIQAHKSECYDLSYEYAKKKVDFILEYAKPLPNEKILDIGCSVGTFAYQTAKIGAIGYGIDYSQGSIEMAKKLCKEYAMDNKTHFTVGNVNKLPYEDKFFDKIIASAIVEHISDEDKDLMIKEMKRVLKDDGVIIVYTPNGVRDKIGLILKKLTFQPYSEWGVAAHFGLISKNGYEHYLKKHKLKYSFQYVDFDRPYLTKIPVINYLLALTLFWVIKK